MAGKKFSNDEAADFLGVKSNTLEVWRSKKKGPKYSKIGSRVLYDIDDLEEFFASRSVHTKERGKTPPQGRNICRTLET